MNAGDTTRVSLEERKYNTIRNCASRVGTQYERVYSVHLHREARLCTITRVR